MYERNPVKGVSITFPSPKLTLIHFERCMKCSLILIVNAIRFCDSVRSDLGPKTLIRPLNHDIRWPSIRQLPITLVEHRLPKLKIRGVCDSLCI